MTKNPLARITCLFWLVLHLSLSACESNTSATFSQESSAPEAAVENLISADLSASQLFSHWVQVDSENDSGRTGDRLVDFLIQLDRQKLQFRERGLDFWRENPSDLRRYSWLILTVALPPSYALDQVNWAIDDLKFGPNRYTGFSSDLAEWEQIYPTLRREFWEDNTVTDAQRRELWWAELHQGFERLREQRVSGRSVDQDKLLADLLEYLEFCAALPGDEGRIGAYLGNLTARIVTIPFGMRLEESQQQLFLQELEARGLHDLANGLTQQEFQTLDSRLRANIGFLQKSLDSDVLNSQLTWSEVIEAGAVGPALVLEMYEIPTIRGFGTWESRVAYYADKERFQRRYLEQGIAFQNDFSNVRDETGWMNFANQLFPLFGANTLETAFLMADRNYAAAATRIDVALRDSVASEFDQAIQSFLDRAENDQQREYGWNQRLFRTYLHAGVSANAEKPTSKLLEQIRYVYDRFGSPNAVEIATGIASDPERFGLAVDELRAFFESYLADPDSDMRVLAETVLDPASSLRDPFDLAAPLLDGTEFEVSSTRGNFVLVDHWDTNCSSCIAAFPRLQQIYETYRDRGFEVVSIVYDGTSNRRMVERLRSELNLTWPILDGEGKWNTVAAKYLYNSFPQYMLLNREGFVVAGNNAIDHGHGLAGLLEEQIPQQPPMWRVSDGDTEVYLYGTIHALGTVDHWFTVQAQQALYKSSITYFEVDSDGHGDGPLSETTNSTMQLDAGQTLTGSLLADRKALLLDAVALSGLRLEEIDTLKPAYAAAKLSSWRMQASGHSTAISVDSVLEAIAADAGKERRYFATPEQQLSYFSDIPIKSQSDYLILVAEQIVTDQSGPDRMVDAWLRGDIAELEAHTIGAYPEKAPDVYRAILVERNREWADQLAGVLEGETGSVFVAGGVGHFLGPDSVQSLLAEKGYRIETVN